MNAIQVRNPGGPEVLEYVEVPKPEPREGELLVRVEAAGVNYIDVYHRSGLYKLPLPFVPGSEGAGIVEATGERVAWAMVPGSYAEYSAVPAEKLVPLPASIDAHTAAAAMLQGMTAHYLVTSTFTLREGHSVLVHAAAGGVGGLLVQIAKQRGARVIATATPAKHEEVRALGADEVLDYADPWPEGMNVVYDSVGKTTFDRSLESLAVRGMLVLFGQSSGPVPPVDPARLAKKGAYLTRPSLAHYTATREELRWRARELFGWLESGEVKLRIDRELPLSEAAEAHRLLESRGTRGKLLLVP
ncbi:MAG TPA: quinone oxidoreductase [Thermoanaerobaculia bacterium]|jgi:NADPH2:quinone reductase|nr:quinone oxidoreductase [Thermoanaerobaculia bacterium]